MRPVIGVWPMGPPIGRTGTDSQEDQRSDNCINLQITHGFSLPSTACAAKCSPPPTKNQVPSTSTHHTHETGGGEPLSNPAVGAMTAVTSVATAVLFNVVASSFVRSFWIRLTSGNLAQP